MAFHSVPVEFSSKSFENLNVTALKEYLHKCGITTNHYKKEILVKLAKYAEELNLSAESDTQQESSVIDLRSKLGERDFPTDDPFSLQFTDCFKNAPKIGLYDIFNFFFEKKTDFDRQATKAYKSFDDYRLFLDGHVKSLQCKPLEKCCCFYAEVQPTKRQKTYINQAIYKMWIITDKGGDILQSFCQCPGGADGACRHIGAALYALEDMSVKSVTDGPPLCVVKNNTCEAPVKLDEIPLIAPSGTHYWKHCKYNNCTARKLPSATSFDPRAICDRENAAERQAQFVKMLAKEMPEATVLECLLPPATGKD